MQAWVAAPTASTIHIIRARRLVIAEEASKPRARMISKRLAGFDAPRARNRTSARTRALWHNRSTCRRLSSPRWDRPANNYQVLAKLAVGGMAEIFLARGVSAAGVERYVVLKRILRDKANDTHFVQMFLEEARLAPSSSTRTWRRSTTSGKLGDSYFFTMEYVHGETVRSMLHQAYDQQREIPLATVLSVIAGRPPACTTRTSASASTGGRSASCTATCRRRT